MNTSRAKLAFIIFLWLLICGVLGGLAFAAGGKSGAQFLTIPVGARPVAMGEAYSGLANDINAVYWNPAGLTQIQRYEETFTHNSWFEGINMENLAIGRKLKSNRKAIAGSLIYLNAGSMDKTNNKGNYVGSYSASDIALGFTYAHRLRMGISWGITTKVIRQSIDSVTANGYGADFGLLQRFKRFQMGVSVLNLGSGVQFEGGQSNPLPMTMKAGAAYRFKKPITLSLDASMADGGMTFGMGGEWVMKRVFALRWGYRSAGTGAASQFGGLSAGFGLQGRRWGLDYTWVPYTTLGSTYRISLTRKVGSTTPSTKKAKTYKKKKSSKSNSPPEPNAPEPASK